MLARRTEAPQFVCNAQEGSSALVDFYLLGASREDPFNIAAVLAQLDANLAQAHAELEAGNCNVATHRLTTLCMYAQNARHDDGNARRALTLSWIMLGLLTADHPEFYPHYPADEFMRNAVHMLCSARKADPELYQRTLDGDTRTGLQRHAVTGAEATANQPCQTTRAMLDAYRSLTE